MISFFMSTTKYFTLSNNLYLNRIDGKYGTIKVDGYEFVDSFSFKVNASSNNSIIFYKMT